MKVLLLHKSQRFDLDTNSLINEKDLTQDLGLNLLFKTMAGGDKFLLDVCKKTLLSFLKTDVKTVNYRQEILKDCLDNTEIVRKLYSLTIEAAQRKDVSWYRIFSKQPRSVLSNSIEIMKIYLDILRKIRTLVEENGSKFHSPGFSRFFDMISKEWSDDYFIEIENHLKALKLSGGISFNGKLTKGNKGSSYQLIRPAVDEKNWWSWLFPKKTRNYTFTIHKRDNTGIRILGEIENKVLNNVANTVAQTNDHLFDFLQTLQTELAFYLGCLNLHTALSNLGSPISFPEVKEMASQIRSFDGLYDISLSLSMKKRLVGNILNIDDKDLIIITGANEGGKTTFLRSIGLSQMMMQTGMFVPAESYTGSLCAGIFTHFKREEDSTMESGKLDEELNRMDQIVNDITPNSMILINESFSSTNEREGSKIAQQIVKALVTRRINVFFVTHLYAFSNEFYTSRTDNMIFLRAERKPDGERTYKLVEGEPFQTSYGLDLYNRIFTD